jgi:hypothetical protein
LHNGPFCCDGAGCQSWLFAERLTEIGNCVRLSMSLRQPVKVTFVGANVNVHAGVTFLDEPDLDRMPGYYGAHRSASNYHGMRRGGGYGRNEDVPPR